MRLQREVIGRGGKPTLGTLTSRDGVFSCVTLERSIDGDHPCVPAGVYRVGYALHHGIYRCPALLDVPGRLGIQIHVANRCAELLGCIAVGERVAADGLSIEDSQVTFDRMMAYLRGVIAWELEIVDPEPRSVSTSGPTVLGVPDESSNSSRHGFAYRGQAAKARRRREPSMRPSSSPAAHGAIGIAA